MDRMRVDVWSDIACPWCWVGKRRLEGVLEASAYADPSRERGMLRHWLRRYAERRDIPFVWFPADDGSHQVKDIRSGEQADADPATWRPADEDLAPTVTAQHSNTSPAS